jgi:group I intron endonuclease
MGRKEKTIHCLYKTTCLITGRYYIGMHSSYKLDDGYMGSGKRLRRSIRKYGKENHVREIIELFKSRDLLVEAEKNYITVNMIKDNNCMNLMSGGTGGLTRGFGWKHSAETKLKISKGNKGKKLSEKTKQKISVKVSETLIGNKRAVGNKSWVGRKHSKDALIKMRDNHPLTKEVEMYDLNNNLINTFKSLHEAEFKTGNLRKHISRCCRGLAKTCGKHIWKFKNYER